MENMIPNVVHPKRFNINGYLIEVATYFTVTDLQAARIAQHGFRRRKWSKKDLGKVTRILWIGDQESLALLG
jgi:hypothetical protein